MNKRVHFNRFLWAAIILLAVGGLEAEPVAAAEPPFEVVARGLDNPHGLVFAHDGPCLPSMEGELCFGLSGAITQVLDGRQTQVVTGLPDPDEPPMLVVSVPTVRAQRI